MKLIALSVTDISQVIDWSVNRPEIIQDKIAIVGISFGGFVSSIAMALDKRVKAGIFIVSGGNSDKVTRNSVLLRRLYNIGEEEYRRNQNAYARYLAEVENKGFENVIAGKSGYQTDPLTFSKYLRDRPVLMLNALWDGIDSQSGRSGPLGSLWETTDFLVSSHTRQYLALVPFNGPQNL